MSLVFFEITYECLLYQLPINNPAINKHKNFQQETRLFEPHYKCLESNKKNSCLSNFPSYVKNDCNAFLLDKLSYYSDH